MSVDAGLSWSRGAPLSADVVVSEPPVSAREFWKRLGRSESFLKRLDDALRAFLAGETAASARAKLSETLDVAEFGAAVLRYVRAHDGAAGLDEDEVPATDPREAQRTFWTAARNLGGGGVGTSLADVRDGPLALLEAGEVVPEVVVELDAEWLDAHHATQVKRWLAFLPVVASACSVRVVVSPIAARRLVSEYGEALPAASVQQLAQSSPTGSATVGEETALPGDREAAREALDVLDRDGPLVAALRAIAAEADQMATYDDLGRHALLAEAQRETWRSRMARLRELELVETVAWSGEDHHRLTTAGLAAVREDAEERGVEMPTPGGSGWEGEHTDEPVEGHSGPTEAAEADGSGLLAQRSEPPKNSSKDRVPIRGQEGAGDDPARDAAAEGRETTRSGGETGRPGTDDWMRPDRTAALHAATNGLDVATCERPAEEVAGRRTGYDEEREELAVSVAYHDTMAKTAVRLCAALTEGPALQDVLTQERLDGAGGDLAGLATDNPYVLRKGRCVGWLPNDGANGAALRGRLIEERNDLLGMLGDLHDDTGEFRGDVASEVLERAHGLLGTLAQLFDLLGVEVVREIRVPNYRRDVHERRHALLRFLGNAIPRSARYGHYSAQRVLYEERPEKRANDNMLGEPETREGRVGEHIGSWVVSGPGTEALLPELRGCVGREQELQRDGENFAAVEVGLSVGSWWRREAVATAVSRMAATKNLRETRAVVSTLQALCGSVHDVAAAVWGLAGEEEERRMDLAEVRPALGRLPAERVLPDAGGHTVSRVVSALLEAEEPLSTAGLAERAGVSAQSVRDNREMLEAFGLVFVEDGGAGKSNWWRVRLPFESERFQNRDVEQRETDEYPSEGDKRRPSALLFERDPTSSEAVLAVLEGPLMELGLEVTSSEEWVDLLTDYRLSAPEAEALAERWPWCREWLEVPAALLGWDAGLFSRGEWLAERQGQERFGASAEGSQATISAIPPA